MKKNLILSKSWMPPIFVYLLLMLVAYGAAPVQDGQAYGGRYLAMLLGNLGHSNALVACLLAGTALFATLAGLFLLCERRKTKPVWLATALTLTMPAAIYSQTYGSLTGALTLAPAAALVLFYLILLEKLLNAENKRAHYALPLFLLGLTASLFHEALSLGLCLLSVGMTVKYWKRGWALILHSVAACTGCLVVLLTSTEAFAAELLLQRAEQVVDGVLATNLPLLLLLTVACLLLIQPLRSERSKRCNRILRELLLPLLGFAVCPYLKIVSLLAALLKIACAAVYCIGLWNTIQIYVSRESRRHHLHRLLAATGSFLLPLLFMADPIEGLLYLPCLLLTAVALLLWGHALHHYGKLEAFCGKLLPTVGITVLCCCVWVSALNGMTDEVRREYTRKQESTGATEICLPEYPFAEYRAEVPVDTAIPVEECPWEDWDWAGYFAERRSSDSQVEDEGETNIIPTFQSDEE